ncbi:MAG: hypothetical protein ABIG44_04165 [Planctomycetota bacterium]
MLLAVIRIVAVIVLLLSGTAIASAQCPLDWAQDFAPRGVTGDVHALAVFDDGSGPALYVGGEFWAAGNASVRNIAKWDGQTWSSLDSDTIHGSVHAIATFDDGSGPALYVGGGAGLRVWNPSERTWSYGGIYGYVYSMVVHDDGSGPALYVGGDFTRAGDITAWHIARWDGQNWSSLPGGTTHGMGGPVYDLAVYDDGSGPALYAAGDFAGAGGVLVRNVAKWDGTQWSDLDGGLRPYYADAYALAVFDPPGPQGPGLYVGGDFATAGDIDTYDIARWDGDGWSAVGDSTEDLGSIRALLSFDDGGGPALYAGGFFTSIGGVEVKHIARWDGVSWSPVGSGTPNTAPGIWGIVHTLAAYDDGGGAALYVGGGFSIADGVVAHKIAKWDGAQYSALNPGHGLYDVVETLEVYDDGGGAALYAGGWFNTAGAVSANYIAKWDGTAWSALGAGMDHRVYGLGVFDDGNGPALYAGGQFTSAGDVSASGIARWDGAAWTALGDGLAYPGEAYALLPFDDGGGPALFVGGYFTNAGGVSVNSVAKWDGQSWSDVGGGVDHAWLDGGAVYAFAVYDDGSGPALYVGGLFTTAGGADAPLIARWDGQNWSDVGGSIDLVSLYDQVTALAVYDDGNGPALYAAGGFAMAGGATAINIARWDGVTWTNVDGELGAHNTGSARALAVFDDGRGPDLYAAGSFSTAGGLAANRVARWDGTRWTALRAGTNSWIGALTVFDDGAGPALYAGGDFTAAGGRGSAYIARWGCVPGLWLGDLNCDGVVNVYDIDPFICAVSPNCDYAAEFPDCNPITGDCNADGIVNAYDIDGFIALLGE